MDLLWVVIIVIVLFSLWIQNGGPAKAQKDGFFNISSPTIISSNNNSSGSNNSLDDSQTVTSFSRYKGKIYLGSGSAGSEYQPSREYIIISASGNEDPINIGGWVLKNGRSSKQYVVSGNTVSGQSVSVQIPKYGLSLFNPYNPTASRRSAISLKSGERAIITTGSPTVFNDVSIKDNFKINRCLGYLEDGVSYQAFPGLNYNCPSNNDVEGVSRLDDICYDFVRSIPSCHVPKDIYVKDEGYCLEGNCKLTSSCRNFVKQNYNFASCFNTYSKDDNFVGPEWRVFLGRTWELWGDRRETIYLYDNFGKLVDKISY